jgi:hypothetical protein
MDASPLRLYTHFLFRDFFFSSPSGRAMQMNYSSDNISDQATCGQHKTTISISGST